MAKKNKSVYKYQLLTISCLFTLSLISAWITPVQGSVNFIPPETVEPAPEKTEGGASRDGGSCAIGKATNKNQSVVKLLPKSNIGLTFEQRPSIMVYIPKTAAQEAFFSIQGENSNYDYQTILQLPEKPGVMEIKLPDSAPALEIGKSYKYSLVLICTEELEPDSPNFSGWIERVQAKGNFLNRKPSVELASELAAKGIWYDALETLANLRKSEPNNQSTVNSWQQLLNSAGLNEIAQEPIVY